MGAASVAVPLQIFGSILSAGAQRKAGAFNEAVANNNAAMAENAASDAVARGEATAGRIRLKGAQLEGEQATAYAASGVDLSSGSAADVMAGSKAMSELDAQTARNNAAREAWGFKTQAQNFRTQGQLAADQGDYGADSSILSGGSHLLGMFR